MNYIRKGVHPNSKLTQAYTLREAGFSMGKLLNFSILDQFCFICVITCTHVLLLVLPLFLYFNSDPN